MFLRSWTVLICIAIVAGVSLSSIPTTPAAEDAPMVKFVWAFGAVTGTGDEKKLIRVERDTLLKSGDQFKMMVRLKTPCYVYVISSNSRGEIDLLFPAGKDRFTAAPVIGPIHYLPKAALWFELDHHAGTETFYLLASVRRLPELEALIQRYASCETSEKKSLSDQIRRQVKDIKSRHRRLSAPAERPVAIGGSIKALTSGKKHSAFDVANVAVEITAPEFASRTFTIDHR